MERLRILIVCLWRFQARYGFGEVSSVSLVGGRPVGLGNDIVTTGAICRDIDVVMFTVLVNWINITILNTPGCICCNIECRDVYSACELDRYILIQSVKLALCASLPWNWSVVCLGWQ